MNLRRLLPVLLVLNVIVLIGQLAPQHAPPFARIVNIIFLLGSLAWFIDTWRRPRIG